MLCSNKCPRGLSCKPLSNVISYEEHTFVCVGLHGEDKIGNEDIYRHCFKSVTTDSMYDYDEYDLLSVISTMSDALLSQRAYEE